MILQALNEYYERKGDLPRLGFEEKVIPYVLVLDKEGTPVNLYCTYEGDGKQKRAKCFLLPQAVKRAVNIMANLLWDNPEYALGVILKGKPERVEKQHEAFKNRVMALKAADDDGIVAVKRFLEIADKVATLKVYNAVLTNLLEEQANLTFQLAGDNCIVAERPAVQRAIRGITHNDEMSAICLATGETAPMERLHTAIKGVRGAQSTGANIVSFNLDAFRSYGKEQGSNAPIGKTAAFAYTTALNHLLGKDSRQKMPVGDATVVFWTGKETPFESQFMDFFSEPPKDDPNRNAKAVESLFKAPQSGSLTNETDTTRFYVLGLAPNASRIAVRFWIVDTVSSMADKVRSHFEDIRVIHGPKDHDTLSLFRLLVCTAVLGKAENIPPNLGGETMRAILEGMPYPQTFLQAAIRRIRAEHDITYARAAVIKACINRSTRFKNPEEKEELKVSLDENNMNVGYRLGRLFALLEKIQQEASPDINATIRDKFYGAASSTPVTVFGNLMRLKNHHLAKLENAGRRVNLERLIGQIMSGISDFPPHLDISDQGRFAIGYYHQMQDFYTKKA